MNNPQKCCPGCGRSPLWQTVYSMSLDGNDPNAEFELECVILCRGCGLESDIVGSVAEGVESMRAKHEAKQLAQAIGASQSTEKKQARRL